MSACDSLCYFVLHFSRNGKEVENAYVSNPGLLNAIVNYLSFDITDDLYMIADSDTIPAIGAVYTRTFGSSTSTNVLVVFDEKIKERSNGDLKLCFDDAMLETGLSQFTFKVSDIKKAPTLTID
jgi:hypothetical protein